MPNWRDYMDDADRAEVAQIKASKAELNAQYRRVYDRCRKRMLKAQREAQDHGPAV